MSPRPAEVELARQQALERDSADGSQLQPELHPYTPDAPEPPVETASPEESRGGDIHVGRATPPPSTQFQRKYSGTPAERAKQAREAYRARQREAREAKEAAREGSRPSLPRASTDPNRATLRALRRQERAQVRDLDQADRGPALAAHAIIETDTPPPPTQRFLAPPPFDWQGAPLSECSRRLKWLQDEAALGVSVLASRAPREEYFRCWCCSDHAREAGGKHPPCYSPTHEKMGPNQPLVRPVSIQTVRVRDSQSGPERLINLYFATPGCLAQYQKRVYGLREAPIISGR